MLRSLWFRTLVLGPAGGGGDLVTPRCSAARSRSDRWAVEGTERQRWWRGGSGWSGRVDPSGGRSGGGGFTGPDPGGFIGPLPWSRPYTPTLVGPPNKGVWPS